MFRWTVTVDLGERDIRTRGFAGAAVDHQLYTFRRESHRGADSEGTEISAFAFNTVSLRWRKLSSAKTGTVRDDIWVNRDEGNWTSGGHSAVAIGRLVYVWGGPRPHSGVLHAFDVDADRWSEPEVSGAIPEGRSDHSACVVRKAMFIYGGHRAGEGVMTATKPLLSLPTMFKLDTDTMVWALIDTRGTSPRPNSGLIYKFGMGDDRWSKPEVSVATGTKIFVFDTSFKEIVVSVFDTETSLWTSTPSVQEHISLNWFGSAFSYNGEPYVAAGGDFWDGTSEETISTSSHLWRFDPATLSQSKVEPKGMNSPAHLSDLCCCVVGERVVYFGDSKLWILDLRPSLKTLCKEAFIQHGLEQSELPHNFRWELAVMTVLR